MKLSHKGYAPFSDTAKHRDQFSSGKLDMNGYDTGRLLFTDSCRDCSCRKQAAKCVFSPMSNHASMGNPWLNPPVFEAVALCPAANSHAHAHSGCRLQSRGSPHARRGLGSSRQAANEAAPRACHGVRRFMGGVTALTDRPMVPWVQMVDPYQPYPCFFLCTPRMVTSYLITQKNDLPPPKQTEFFH